MSEVELGEFRIGILSFSILNSGGILRQDRAGECGGVKGRSKPDTTYGTTHLNKFSNGRLSMDDA